MSDAEHTSLFDSFNARNLAPEQVARTFVPPQHFAALIGQHHTLVIGPRGSGKTTLLKMLQPEALDAWTTAESKDIKANIPFCSVYIGTDISWGKQISSLGGAEVEEPFRALLATASFTTQIMRRLVDVLSYLVATRPQFRMIEETEAAVAGELARTFGCNAPVVSLLGLKYELGRRHGEIHAFASEEATIGSIGRAERFANEKMLHLSFIACTSTAIDIINDAVHQPHARWAFLFDELELAPEPIRRYLLQSLRSVDDRLLFKLSLVPFGRDNSTFADILGAQPGQDFEIIPLWYSHKDQGVTFCKRLWESMLASRGIPMITPEKVFGPSLFETRAAEWEEQGTAYHTNSKLSKRFMSLAAKDETFASFLRNEGIEIEQFERLSGDQRASTVRKATTIVAMRDAFIESGPKDGKPSQLRTRKVPDVYSGADSLFAITEGNPRWFKGIVGPLLETVNRDNPRVTPSTQYRRIEKSFTRFRSLLRTVPSPPWKGNQPSRGLLSLLDAIGEFFKAELLLNKFTLDPCGTITVDARTKPSIIDCLGSALNMGAIVSIDELESPSVSLRGKRFRLSYLLAVFYHISLRLERSVPLSTALGLDQQSAERSLFSEERGNA